MSSFYPEHLGVDENTKYLSNTSRSSFVVVAWINCLALWISIIVKCVCWIFWEIWDRGLSIPSSWQSLWSQPYSLWTFNFMKMIWFVRSDPATDINCFSCQGYYFSLGKSIGFNLPKVFLRKFILNSITICNNFQLSILLLVSWQTKKYFSLKPLLESFVKSRRMIACDNNENVVIILSTACYKIQLQL